MQIDLDQPARLFVTTTVSFGGGNKQVTRDLRGEGSLRDLLEIFRKLQPAEVENAQLTINGGFHLDGGEIQGLIWESGV